MALEGRFSCPVQEGTKHSLILVDSYCLLLLPCVGAVSCGPGGQVLLSCPRRNQAQPHAGGQLLSLILALCRSCLLWPWRAGSPVLS